MATVTQRPDAAAREEPGVPPALAGAWIAALTGWHALLAAGALSLLLATWLANAGPRTGLARAILTALLVALLVANAAAIPLLTARNHLGRTLSLAVNYLGLLGCLVLLLHTTRVFVGLDALGSTFVRGLPFLGLGVLGYLITGLGDRPERPAPLRRPGRIVMLVAAAGFLVAVGLLQGVATFASRLAGVLPLGLLAAALLCGIFARFVWRTDVARAFGASAGQEDLLNGLLFLSPNLLGFLGFFVGPLLFSLVISFFSWDALGVKVFNGIDNYIRIFSIDVTSAAAGESGFDVLQEGYREVTRFGSVVVGARDPLFWIAMRNVLLFAVMAIPAAVLPALFLANLLNSKAPGIKVFRALYFIPTVAGVVGVTLIWKQLLNASVGYVNYGIRQVADLFNVADPSPNWLSDSDVALFSLVIVFAWQYIGYNSILFLAGLQGVPADLYEAAHLDGATRWQRFRNITLPQLGPTTFFVVATTGILALQLFSEAVILLPGFQPPGSGPNNATLTPVGYLYQQGFQQFAQGYASSVAWVLFLFIFGFTFIQFQRQRAEV